MSCVAFIVGYSFINDHLTQMQIFKELWYFVVIAGFTSIVAAVALNSDE